eukprot:1148143-Pelagomonas_calceolata.AAC.1
MMGGLGVLCQDPVSCCKKTEILYFYTIHTQYKKAAVMHVRDLGARESYEVSLKVTKRDERQSCVERDVQIVASYTCLRSHRLVLLRLAFMMSLFPRYLLVFTKEQTGNSKVFTAAWAAELMPPTSGTGRHKEVLLAAIASRLCMGQSPVVPLKWLEGSTVGLDLQPYCLAAQLVVYCHSDRENLKLGN